jgi:hypothetical protein
MYTSKPEQILKQEAINSAQITQLIINKGLPGKDDSTFLQLYRLSDFGLRKSDLSALLNELTPKLTKHKSDRYEASFRENLRYVIYGLVASFYRFEWLAIPFGDSHYHSSKRLGKLGFSRRRMTTIMSLLEQDGLAVLGRKGFRDPSGAFGSRASQYFPTQKLIDIFQSLLYEFEDDFNLPSFHKFNCFPEGSEPSPEQYDSTESLLRSYNLFMANHWWAKKGPTTRSFSRNLGRGGRLNCSYQTIVNRRLPIRQTTLLDGEPIAEPDFSANHFRMSAALLGEALPDDPYSIISKQTDCSRQQVKAFVTMVLGCESLRQKGGQISKLEPNKHNLTRVMYKKLLASFEKEYPWVKLQKIFYNDTGARMQLLEGEIGLRMFQWALDKEIPILSVHDSYAVRERDQERTEEKMHDVWNEVIEKYRKSAYR